MRLTSKPSTSPSNFNSSQSETDFRDPSGRLTYRLAELAQALGISRRTLERERSAGRFPAPDLHIGKAPLWRPGTVQAWIEAQSRKPSGQGGGR